MMRSLFSGVSGLRVHQTKMDVIANNIANVNTTGYKSSRVTFYDVFNQTLSGAMGASEDTGRGGRNPMQIGLGSNVASIDQLMTTGATQRTDNPWDVMIQGDGFFIVSDTSGYYFTRAGAFRVDDAGNLTTAGGMAVNGWMREMNDDTGSDNYGQWQIQKGKVQPIRVTSEMESTPPSPTTRVNIEGNLNAALDGDGYVSTISFYDTVGNRYVADIRYTYDADNGAWEIEVVEDPADGTNVTLVTNTGNQRFAFQTLEFSQTTLAFNNFGELIDPPLDTDTGLQQIVLTVEGADDMVPPALFGQRVATTDDEGATTGEIFLDLRGLTQFGSLQSNASGLPQDGKAAGKLIAISIGGDGVITGTYSNGTNDILAQLAITQFKNPAGLEKVGSSLFIATNNSGEFDGVGMAPGDGGTSMVSGSLEMANVDLASEFTEMITTQRGFQANSRTITTSDDMLQELVNLKR